MTSKGSRLFEGLEVMDAEAPTSIPLLQVDIDNAEAVRSKSANDPHRFTSCVLAQASKRTFGEGAKVRFNRTNCLVSWEGAEYALRYQYSDAARHAVERFDRGEPLEPGTLIVLKPPSKRRRLSVMRKNWESHREQYNASRTDRKQKKSDPVIAELRNGVFARWES